LRGFDYGQAGAYFVTTCTQDRECVFGSIYNGEMTLNVVMPNHIHGIIILPVGAGPSAYPDIMNQQNIGQPAGVKGQPSTANFFPAINWKTGIPVFSATALYFFSPVLANTRPFLQVLRTAHPVSFHIQKKDGT
jgi:hypothetical protein